MDRMVITNQMIEDGMSENGGWSNKQIMLLGFGRYTGWRKRAVGKEILTEKYKKFLSLKNIHLKKKHKTSTLLANCIKFILENFSEDGSEFYCGYQDYCEGDCDRCSIPSDFTEIMEEFNK